MKIAASNVELSSRHYEKTVTEEAYHKGTIIGGLFNEEILKNMDSKKSEKEATEKRDTFELSEEETGDDCYSFTPYTMMKLNKTDESHSLLENQVKSLHQILVERIIAFMERLFELKYGRAESPLSGALSMMKNSIYGGSSGYMVAYEHQSYYHHEEERTGFEGKGQAITEDGRVIDFNLSFAVSRSFSEAMSITSGKTITLTDPLVINFGDSALAEISDQSFYFDIDSDGMEDSIHSLGAGSGFLALDKDGNGKIDNGSELFGTKSGDGFKDLEEYDEDHNGWIDENDSVYDKLKVWCRDSEGHDALMSLKEVDIGAIFLDRADTGLTDRSFEPEKNFEVKGVIRRTGVFLKESGGVGTVQHVDLARSVDQEAG